MITKNKIDNKTANKTDIEMYETLLAATKFVFHAPALAFQNSDSLSRSMEFYLSEMEEYYKSVSKEQLAEVAEDEQYMKQYAEIFNLNKQ